MTLIDAGVNSDGDVAYCNDKFIINSQSMRKIKRYQRPVIKCVKFIRNVGESTTLLTIFCLLSVYLSSISGVVTANSLEEVDDQELQKLLVQENYVAVLFSDEGNAEKTEEYEMALGGAREDLVDSLSAWVVKASKSEAMRKFYSPDTVAPTVVFFRKRKPVVYDGPADEEEVLETFMQWREPCQQDLTDTNFEHLTQASSGATTGDWLVHFFRDDCDDCHKLDARLETVACKHKGTINVARINKASTGAITGRRMGVTKLPSLIFYRHGKLYRYEIEKYDIESLSSFITGWYKNAQGESIPLPKTPFDDFVQMCVDYLRDYPLLFIVMVGIPLFLLISFIYLMRPETEEPKKRKKKKKEKKDKDS